MRGKETKMKNYNLSSRITPAYAGKSGFSVAKGAIAEDHPRLCGEKAKETKEFSGELGSPPPMRGKVSERC